MLKSLKYYPFKSYIEQLNQFALEQRDYTLYADLIIDQLPPDSLSQLLSDPELITQFAKIVPGVEQNRAWFESLMSHIRAVLAEQAQNQQGGSIHTPT